MGKDVKSSVEKRSTVTMRDVARESGFSPTTVSITLNDAPLARYLPAATKTRIKQVARRLGYRPNPFARSLINRRSHTLGIMVFDVTDPYCTMILRGIEQTLYDSSYVPILTDAQNDTAHFERYLEMLLDRRVEGLIIIANWLFLEIDIVNDLAKCCVPTAVIGSKLNLPNVSTVHTDNQKGAYQAISCLHGLGHRQIAFIRGPESLSDTDLRWRGVLSFAKEAGLELNSELIYNLPDSRLPSSSFEGGYQLAQRLLRSGRAFTAIMAFDDLSALGAMRALHEAGVRIPQQCSVIGFDDVPAASLATPGLTTIRQPMELMGSTAASIVLDSISPTAEGRHPEPVRRVLDGQLVLRNSTGRVDG